jgi:signal transduction histidine kinase
LPEVLAHKSIVVQMLVNLIYNSLKFVEAGVQPCVRIWAEENAATVRLWIQDNGIGIASEHQQRIFRVFERLHGSEQYPGTGIGLANVRKSAERMGGRVGVESQPQQGSRFWVELPKPPAA